MMANMIANMSVQSVFFLKKYDLNNNTFILFVYGTMPAFCVFMVYAHCLLVKHVVCYGGHDIQQTQRLHYWERK